MRYNVHPPRAFRNRIAKSTWVLVATALVATLGLPSVAQAQIIKNNTAMEAGGIVHKDGTGFDIMWSTRSSMGINNWIVTVTKPDGTKMVVNKHSTVQTTLGAVKTTVMGGAANLGLPDTKTLTYLATDLGEWWFQVSACTAELTPDTVAGTCPSGKSEAGDAVGYTHGPPAAPTNLAANAVPTGVALTWTDMKSDRAISKYEYAYQTKADGKPDWKPVKGTGSEVIKADPGEHTFMLRALGSSDNSPATASPGDIPGEAASAMVTVPMPTPTLPEIAALFLAMLLLGSGAYLLRGRQSGGLTHA